MKAAVTVVCLSVLSAVAASAGKTVRDFSNYSFDQFVKDFNLKYEKNELSLRQNLFEAEKLRVQQHNAQKLSWHESINKFSAMTPQEKKSLYGRNKAAAAHHGHKLKSEHGLPSNFVMKPLKDLPTSVDWREKGVVSAVKDQGSCGSCWAFGSTATIESHVAIATGLLYDLSVQQMAMCAPNDNHCGGTGGCGGSTAELAFDYVTSSHGLYQEYQYGYTSYYGKNMDCKVPGVTSPVVKIDGYVQLPGNDYNAVMNALANVGPVAINVDASTWGAYHSGVFNGCNPNTSDINHVVVAVGYGVDSVSGLKYWLVRNSWSPGYGEEGYIRVLRTDNDASVCQVDKTPQDGVACDGQNESVTTCGTCGVIYDVSYPLNAKAAY